MGYSTRYHAASLAAVFLALGIGILIGVGFGDAVVSDTQKNLERSLSGDLDEAREAADELRRDLRRRREFERRVYPVLVADRLVDRRIGVIAVGGLPDGISANVRDALAPSGGRLAAVSVLRAPVDLEGLAEALERTRYGDLASDADSLAELAERTGLEMVRGGRLLRRLRNRLLSRASGAARGLDGVILVRDRPDELEEADERALNRFEGGVLRGIRDAGVPVVAVERSDQERSSVGFFEDRQISTVDSIDLESGRVALIFALAGAEGAFGIRDSADQLLPEPLVP